MAFCMFVGANHQSQSILFACALLADEREPNYRWVFQKWKTCMFGKLPGAIITDQCKSICKAVQAEMPGVRHRMCLWHIMRKVGGKVSKHWWHDALSAAVHDIVYDSLSAQAKMVGVIWYGYMGWKSTAGGSRSMIVGIELYHIYI